MAPSDLQGLGQAGAKKKMPLSTSSKTAGIKGSGSSAVTPVAAPGSVERPKGNGRASRRSSLESTDTLVVAPVAAKARRRSSVESADAPALVVSPVPAKARSKKVAVPPSESVTPSEFPERSKAQLKNGDKSGTAVRKVKQLSSDSQAQKSVVSEPASIKVCETRSKGKKSKTSKIAGIGHDVTSELVNTTPLTSELSGSCAPTIAAAIAEAEVRPIERYVGLDIGTSTEFCEIKDGQVSKRATVHKEHVLQKLLGSGTPRARIVFEACREGWYLHDLLSSWGHEVWMADTTRVRQMGIGQHKRKNDRIDAEVLARAAESGRVPRAHILSYDRQQLRTELAVRRSLVETRAQYVTQIRSILRSEGIKAASCDTQNFVNKLEETGIPKELRDQIAPLVLILTMLEPQLKRADELLDNHCEDQPVVILLCSAPGVGRIVSAAFISVVDDPNRFRKAHQLEAYLGLVPSESTSGRRKVGSITKQGNGYLRSMLVQAAWNILRQRATDPLKTWALALAKKSGKRVAVVALARRLAGVLWAMWRNNQVYDRTKLGKASADGKHEEAERTQHTARAIQSVSVQPA